MKMTKTKKKLKKLAELIRKYVNLMGKMLWSGKKAKILHVRHIQDGPHFLGVF